MQEKRIPTVRSIAIIFITTFPVQYEQLPVDRSTLMGVQALTRMLNREPFSYLFSHIGNAKMLHSSSRLFHKVKRIQNRQLGYHLDLFRVDCFFPDQEALYHRIILFLQGDDDR
jgi:hypothetical protein